MTMNIPRQKYATATTIDEMQKISLIRSIEITEKHFFFLNTPNLSSSQQFSNSMLSFTPTSSYFIGKSNHWSGTKKKELYEVAVYRHFQHCVHKN